MIVLPDTNAILRYLLADNPAQYKKSSEFFEKVRSGEAKALILESVLVECVYVLTKYYKVPRTETAGKLESLLRYKGIENADSEELINSLRIFAGKNIDIVDCVLFAKANQSGCAMLTFDEKLLKLKV